MSRKLTSNMAPVTVITPVYNGALYIAETIESVARQVPKPARHIIIDDGSTDDTAQILTAYADIVDVVTQANRGEAEAVNRGVSFAETDLVAVVNADDPVLPGWLETMMAVFNEKPNLCAAYPDWTMIGPNGAAVRTVRTHPFDLHVMLGQHLCIPGPGAVFRKSCVPDGVVRIAERGSSADFDFWLRIGLEGKVLRVPEILATWRSHQEGTSLAGGDIRMAHDKIGVMQVFFQRPSLPQEIAALKQQALSAAYFNAGILGLRNASIPSVRLFMRSLWCKFWWPRDVLPSQRRSALHMIYAASQPFSGFLHSAAGPILPKRFRLEALMSQSFGEIDKNG